MLQGRAMSSKIPLLLGLLSLASFSAAPAAVLFSDNFDAPDTNNLDLSDQTGRRAGLNPEIQVRSSYIQHGISAGALTFLKPDGYNGRIRFHEDADNNTATAGAWFDWAAGTTGSAILAAGGLTVEFDWNAGNSTSTNWVAIVMGIGNEASGEPGGRVNHVGTDSGILFRFNGGSEIFDNGANQGAGGSVLPFVGVRSIRVDYLFDSFADGSLVSVQAWSDGTSLYSGSFAWDGNNSQLFFEVETAENTSLDNLRISTVPEPSGVMLLAAGSLVPLLCRRRN